MSAYPRRQVLGAGAGTAAAAVVPLAGGEAAAGTADQAAAGTAAVPVGGRDAAHAGPWGQVPAPVQVPLDEHFDNDGIDTATAHDFMTPEYATYDNTVAAKWESSRGLDPFSYGYNRATPDDQYMTAEEVVHSLVDIVSKNGNFLLDIGPRADGTIPEIMQTRLRETGQWLQVHGEAIYGTTYWSRMAQLGDDLRFTVKQNEAFYIHSLAAPGAKLTVEAPVPIRSGDRVTMLGHPRPLTWSVRNGALVIDVPAAVRKAGRNVWVFKVEWHG